MLISNRGHQAEVKVWKEKEEKERWKHMKKEKGAYTSVNDHHTSGSLILYKTL